MTRKACAGVPGTVQNDRAAAPYRRYAFFDLDGTLISDTSILAFYKYFLESEYPLQAEQRYNKFTERLGSLRQGDVARDEINRWFYASHFAGVEVERLRCTAERWLESRYTDHTFLKPRMLALVLRHRAHGVGTVIVTGSFREVVEPLARRIGIGAYIAAPLDERAGIYTGALTDAPTIGQGKASAVTRFLALRGIDPESCYGYGDDHTDIPFLECLGHPHALASGTGELLAYARHAGWALVGD